MQRSGKINVGCIIMAVVLAIAGVAAYQIIPLRVRTAEMKGEVKRVAERLATEDPAHFPLESATKMLLEKAKELELPITEKQIRVERTPQVGRITVDYQVTVDIIGFKYPMKFNHFYESPRFD